MATVEPPQPLLLEAEIVAADPFKEKQVLERGGKRGRSFLFTLKRMRSRARRNLGDESVSGLFDESDPGDHAGGSGDKPLEKMRVSTQDKSSTWSNSLSAVWSGLLAPDVVANQLIEPENGEGGLGEYRCVGLLEDGDEDEDDVDDDHHDEKKRNKDEEVEEDGDLQSVKLQTPHLGALDQMKVATEKTKDKITWAESLTKVASIALAPELYAHEVLDSVANDGGGRGAYRFVGCEEEEDGDDHDEDLENSKKKKKKKKKTTGADATMTQDLMQDLISILRHAVGRLRTQVRDLETKLRECEEENLMWKARVHELEASLTLQQAAAAAAAAAASASVTT